MLDILQGAVRGAPLPVFLMMIGFPLLLTGIFLFAAIWSLRNAWFLRTARRRPVSKLTGGYELAEGRVSKGSSVSAPLTGRACAWYSLSVEEEIRTYRHGRHGYHWKIVREETSRRPIPVSDGEATCEVLPDGATVHATEWSEWAGPYKTPSDRDPARVAGNEPRRGRAGLHVDGDPSRRFRYFERYVYPDDPIFALGHVERTEKKGKPRISLSKPEGRKPFLIATRSPDKVHGESDLAMQGGFIMAAISAGAAASVWLLRYG